MSDMIEVIGARAVEADLGKVLVRSLKGIEGAVIAGGIGIRNEWRANATATAGKHGKYYPRTIEDHRRLSIGGFAVDIEPNTGMPQGGMSFELGSSKQPAHLDGQKAADHLGPAVARRIGAAVVVS